MHYALMWPTVIQHLRTLGHSQDDLARHAGVDQSTISRLAMGRSEPRYSVGQALIELAGGQVVCDRLMADLPATAAAEEQAREVVNE